MKKIFGYPMLVVLAAVIAVVGPRLGEANQKVDAAGCLACHAVGVFGAGDGSIHGSHSNCAGCHTGIPGAGNVFASACLTCHPAAGSEKCDLVNFHEDLTGYNPSGASCLDCHSNCGGSTTTTTTTTTTVPSVKGKRYEIFLIGPFREGCRSTAAEFRSDNVLVLDCLNGFGMYLSIGGSFTAVYWSNNYYLGYGMGMVLTGFAADPYIAAGGLAFFGNMISTVALSGYIL